MTGGSSDGVSPAAGALSRGHARLLSPLTSPVDSAEGDVECAIRGSSMAPAIPPGARLQVRFGGQPGHVGDVVLYLADGGYTVHRVVYRARRTSDADRLLTEGD